MSEQKEEYREFLKSEKWKQQRERVLNRDKKKCVICGSEENLIVHHMYYLPKVEDTPDAYLVTMCKSCHNKEHLIEESFKFLRDSIDREIVYRIAKCVCSNLYTNPFIYKSENDFYKKALRLMDACYVRFPVLDDYLRRKAVFGNIPWLEDFLKTIYKNDRISYLSRLVNENSGKREDEIIEILKETGAKKSEITKVLKLGE